MTTTAPPSPPCLVLGIDTQIGLGVIRELGRAGIPVIGLANRANSIGLTSRYLHRGLVAGPRRDEALVARIRALGEEYGEAVLLAISETDLTWLIANANRLGRVRAVTPPPEAFRSVLDKTRTLELARQVGIRVPVSVHCETLADWQRAAASVRYPVIVKWADPMSAARRLQPLNLKPRKLEYALDADALLAIGRRYEAAGVWPLVQEYCPGRGLGQFFFMHEGRAVRRFQHLRIAEWPPEGGFSSVCDAVPLSQHADLQERSIALLQALGWEGVAMVEYRLDEATGEAVLMEINGRFWGSFPLAVHAGAGFALLAYGLQGLGRMPELPPLADDLRCRMGSTELKRLARILFQPGRIADPHFRRRPAHEAWRYLRDFLRPKVRYYLWSGDDPRPFFADLRNVVRKLLPS
ncbi:carboxylate--amine ligase [Pseudothauera rhizosphaerae]|uniref:Carboxylate--amine ligase n=1 Tax=Pseudothauera rhizosphaerae TaxID=2565932 RepID=A0A4S4APQ7_9RHOO|nr:carboxylate--amine ligase [Pseudothauera rhizosphaerae]THF61621.1 carboxylate--amine ligase [Pseudothauera rhizosphaerae]